MKASKVGIDSRTPGTQAAGSPECPGFSVIFDMDGVLVDNRRYHFRPGRFSPAHRKKELRQAHFVINHFDTLTFEKLRSLVEPGEKEDE